MSLISSLHYVQKAYGITLDVLLLFDALIYSVIATGIVDLRILPLAGLRRIIGRLDRALRGNPDTRRSWSRCVATAPGKLIAGY